MIEEEIVYDVVRVKKDDKIREFKRKIDINIIAYNFEKYVFSSRKASPFY